MPAESLLFRGDSIWPAAGMIVLIEVVDWYDIEENDIISSANGVLTSPDTSGKFVGHLAEEQGPASFSLLRSALYNKHSRIYRSFSFNGILH